MVKTPNITLSAGGLFRPANLYFEELSIGYIEPDGVVVRGKCTLPFKGEESSLLIDCRTSLQGRFVLQGVFESNMQIGLMIGIDNNKLLLGLLCDIPINTSALFGIAILQKKMEWFPAVISACVPEFSLSGIISTLSGLDENCLGWMNIFEIKDFEICPDKSFFNNDFHVKQIEENIFIYTELFSLKHYKVIKTDEGLKVSLPPQLYISLMEKELTFGDYSMSPGAFFCAELIIFNVRHKCIFSFSKNGAEVLSKLNTINLKYIKITDAGDDVPTFKATDILKQYGTDSNKGATFFLRLTRDMRQVYISAYLELFEVFRFKTKIVYNEGFIDISYLYEQFAGFKNVFLHIHAANDEFESSNLTVNLKISADNFDALDRVQSNDMFRALDFLEYMNVPAETNDKVERHAEKILSLQGYDCWDAAYHFFAIGSEERYETGLCVSEYIVSETYGLMEAADDEMRERFIEALKKLLYISEVKLTLNCCSSKWEAELHLEYVFIGRLFSKNLRFRMSYDGFAKTLLDVVLHAIDFLTIRNIYSENKLSMLRPDAYGAFISEQEAAFRRLTAAQEENTEMHLQLYDCEKPDFDAQRAERVMLNDRQAVQTRAILGFLSELKNFESNDHNNILVQIENAIKNPEPPLCNSGYFLDLEYEPVFTHIKEQLYKRCSFKDEYRVPNYKPRVRCAKW